MSKKIPVHFSDEMLKDIDDIAESLGMSPQVYGYVARALRFSIAYTIAGIRKDEAAIPGLKPDELALFFQAISHARKKRLADENLLKAQNDANNV